MPIFKPEFLTKNLEQDRKLRTLLKYAKRRAKAKKLEFDLKASDIPWTDACPVLGTTFTVNRGQDLGPSPTLDRVDSTKGYIKGNVRVISWKANQLKSDLTLEQVHRMYLYMKGEL